MLFLNTFTNTDHCECNVIALESDNAFKRVISSTN